MGFWKKFGGIAGMIGGGVLAATGNVPAGLALMGVGSSLMKNDAETEAADKAQAYQEKAAAEALAIQKGVYEQTRADISPYMGYGSGVMSNLGAMVGLPAQTNPAAAPQGARPPGGPILNAALGGPPKPGSVGAVASGKKPGTLARLVGANSPQEAIAARSASSYRPSSIGAATGGGGMVRLRAPDGAMRVVDPQAAERLKALGAVEV